jgi:hypothetical protein
MPCKSPIACLALLLLPLVSPTLASEDLAAEKAAAAIAEEAGAEFWTEVEALEFTINAKVDDETHSRTWKWQPKTGEFTSSDEAANQETFYEDALPLLFPLRLAWDRENVELSLESQPVSAPLSNEKLKKLTVKYKKGSATYVLYYGDDFFVKEWTMSSELEEPLTQAWAEPQAIGNQHLCFQFSDAGKPLLWYTNVKLTTANGTVSVDGPLKNE